MVKVYTSAEMRLREQIAVDAGSSFEQLMENAGQAAAKDLLLRFPNAGCALMVCGKGNNGGDALVIARVLAKKDWQVDVYFVLGNRLSELSELNRGRLKNLDRVRLIESDQLPLEIKYDVVVDGIFGTGFTGALPEQVAGVCRQLNGITGAKIALDIPTGLNGDTAEYDQETFQADITYAFAALKPAHLTAEGKRFSGEVICLDIGID
ncbi:NAD(P)H-hydrate epimerase [Neisseria weaveri]|uniref:NAD(P)H-hydrate epimerase n=1 Tax=Neisseria weaveri TaxID=28091 RepID=UPI00022326C3|nr:NAD(P)H-hydrate epimerase [Neisseria weaveri]EGV34828.1 YjeF protein [Neisseria weaveri ATCC 51223]